tara:strand:+ start:986 stop:1111 length:126 start_codon:yes stop_codon:yes gene_type:complete
MVHFFKHLLGLCGEPHPNIFTILLGVPILTYLIYYIKNLLK